MMDDDCEWCGQMYRPRVPDQRFCGMECRLQGKAAEGRAARRSWWAQGRPVFNDDEPKALPEYRRV
jgi:hypothetical protein